MTEFGQPWARCLAAALAPSESAQRRRQGGQNGKNPVNACICGIYPRLGAIMTCLGRNMTGIGRDMTRFGKDMTGLEVAETSLGMAETGQETINPRFACSEPTTPIVLCPSTRPNPRTNVR